MLTMRNLNLISVQACTYLIAFGPISREKVLELAQAHALENFHVNNRRLFCKTWQRNITTIIQRTCQSIILLRKLLFAEVPVVVVVVVAVVLRPRPSCSGEIWKRRFTPENASYVFRLHYAGEL